jgi:uncharacterized repeat protein (TIGR02543 family)
MRKTKLILIVSSAFLLILFNQPSKVSAIEVDFVGYVDYVNDGESFNLTSGERIWLADVSAPSLSEPSGVFSREYLNTLIQGHKVYLERSRLNEIVNGSLACLVYIDYEAYYFLNVNMEMVTNGGCVIQDLFNSFDPTVWQRIVLHTIPPAKTSYSLSIDMPDGLGTTYPPMGTQKYSVGLVISISATPLTGWKLAYWMLDGNYAGSHNPLMVTMTADHYVRAFFVQTSPEPPKNYILTVVTSSGEGHTTPVSGTYEYGKIMDIPVTALPAEGWTFSHWTFNNRSIGSINPIQIIVDSPISLKAYFIKINYTLTTNFLGEGSITKTPDKNYYNYGDSIQLKAQPKIGYVFSGWSGSISGITNPVTIIISGNRIITAKFTSAIEPTYSIIILPSQGQGSTNPASGNYQYTGNTNISITATPQNGWLLDYWTVGGIMIEKSNPLNLVVSSNMEIKAFFKSIPTKNYTLTMQTSGNGLTTTSSGSTKFSEDSYAYVTANPSVGWSFSNWILDDSNAGEVNPLAVKMDKDHIIVAVFKQTQQPSFLTSIPSYPEGSILSGLLFSLVYIYIAKKKQK